MWHRPSGGYAHAHEHMHRDCDVRGLRSRWVGIPNMDCPEIDCPNKRTCTAVDHERFYKGTTPVPWQVMTLIKSGRSVSTKFNK